MYGDPHVLGRKVSPGILCRSHPNLVAPSAALIGRSRMTPRRTAARAGPASGAAPNSRLSTQASAGRGTRLTRADAGPAAPTLRSAQRSVRSRWASFVEIRGDSGAPLNARVARGGPLAARWQCHQSGSTVWCAQPNTTRQPTHELTVSTGTENSDRYGTASDEMRCGLSSCTLMHSPSSNLAR